MSDELRPCAHCGGDYEVEEWKHADWTDWRVMCGRCGASTDWYSSREFAIAAWNRRADEPQVIKNAEYYNFADDSRPQVITNGEKHELADSRERLEEDVREICWGYDFYRYDAQKRYLDERGLDVREDIVTTNYDGHVLATVIMHLLDRQTAITERECREYPCNNISCSIALGNQNLIAENRELHKHVDSLTAELRHKQNVCDVQRDSFLKMERENRELQDVCGELERTIENMRGVE